MDVSDDELVVFLLVIILICKKELDVCELLNIIFELMRVLNKIC